jgi:hypothetical protein
MDTRILTGTVMDRRFTGIMVIEFITRGPTIGITATGVKPQRKVEPAGGNARRFIFSVKPN